MAEAEIAKKEAVAKAKAELEQQEEKRTLLKRAPTAPSKLQGFGLQEEGQAGVGTRSQSTRSLTVSAKLKKKKGEIPPEWESCFLRLADEREIHQDNLIRALENLSYLRPEAEQVANAL